MHECCPRGEDEAYIKAQRKEGSVRGPKHPVQERVSDRFIKSFIIISTIRRSTLNTCKELKGQPEPVRTNVVLSVIIILYMKIKLV